MKNILCHIKEITELEIGRMCTMSSKTLSLYIVSQSYLGISEGHIWFALLTSQNSTNDL